MDGKRKKEKKINFIEKKNCALNSLREVNCFLSKLNTVNKIKKITKIKNNN